MLCLTTVLAGCSNGTKSPAVETPKAEEADVVVIGAGGAGLAAAVSAAEKGAEVIVVEKMPAIGGNTMRSGGIFNAVDPEKQKAQGIEDSIEKHISDTLKGGDNVADPALVTVLCENALDRLQWLESYGMKFDDEIVQGTGALWPRTHQSLDPGGTGFVKTLKAAADKLGVKFYLETQATELVTNDQGRVVGVKCEDKDKKPVEYTARKGVVVASGGFAANVEMRKKYNPNLTSEVPSTNQPGATGDGIIMAEKLGADLVGMEYIQVHPLCEPVTGQLRGRARSTGAINNIIVVNQDGLRFVSEEARRDDFTAAILKQKDGLVYEINDAQIAIGNNQWGENIEELVKEGKVTKTETIEELEQALKMPAGNLEKTIAAFNKMVENKQDPDFGRTLFDKKIEQGPFYAVARVPSVHHTMGGLKINTEAQVLKKDGSVIPGLYAAGEVTGGIHGGNRLGGNALADIIVFGSIAGRNAAVEEVK